MNYVTAETVDGIECNIYSIQHLEFYQDRPYTKFIEDNLEHLIMLRDAGVNYVTFYGNLVEPKWPCRDYGLTDVRCAIAPCYSAVVESLELPKPAFSVVPVFTTRKYPNISHYAYQLEEEGSLLVPGYNKPAGVCLYPENQRTPIAWFPVDAPDIIPWP